MKERVNEMRPNPISLETAKMLSEKLKMPIEHVMHMPAHILTQKLAELAQKEQNSQHKDK
jgi:tRNA A37 threonylcarbamoyltransferase TsaD